MNNYANVIMLSLKIVCRVAYNNYTELGKYATIVIDTEFLWLSLPIDFVGTKSASL